MSLGIISTYFAWIIYDFTFPFKKKHKTAFKFSQHEIKLALEILQSKFFNSIFFSKQIKNKLKNKSFSLKKCIYYRKMY